MSLFRKPRTPEEADAQEAIFGVIFFWSMLLMTVVALAIDY